MFFVPVFYPCINPDVLLYIVLARDKWHIYCCESRVPQQLKNRENLFSKNLDNHYTGVLLPYHL